MRMDCVFFSVRALSKVLRYLDQNMRLWCAYAKTEIHIVLFGSVLCANCERVDDESGRGCRYLCIHLCLVYIFFFSSAFVWCIILTVASDFAYAIWICVRTMSTMGWIHWPLCLVFTMSLHVFFWQLSIHCDWRDTHAHILHPRPAHLSSWWLLANKLFSIRLHDAPKCDVKMSTRSLCSIYFLFFFASMWSMCVSCRRVCVCVWRRIITTTSHQFDFIVLETNWLIQSSRLLKVIVC